MIKFDFIENSKHPLEPEIIKYIPEILDIGKKIKKELGLRKNPFAISDGLFGVDSIAGSISFVDVHINIWPKNWGINSTDKKNSEMLKKLYCRVFETCKKNLNKTIYISKYQSINSLDCKFINAISEQFVEELENSIKYMKITSHETKIERRQSIRGKVLVQKELRNPIIEPKIWCKYRALSEDNNNNRLLLWCCKYLGSMISDFKIRNRLERLIHQFHGVNIKLLDLNFVHKLIIPRQYHIYFKCLNIARDLFLNNYNRKEINSQNGKILGYMINMEKAFENIVEVYVESAARKIGLEHKAQHKKKLANSITGSTYSVKPDNIVISSEDILIIDAKYKLQSMSQDLKKTKPTREDFYQMVATAIAYNSYNVILVYPEIFGSSKCEDSWEVDNSINGKKIRITSKQIDIIAQKETLESRLMEILLELKSI